LKTPPSPRKRRSDDADEKPHRGIIKAGTNPRSGGRPSGSSSSETPRRGSGRGERPAGSSSPETPRRGSGGRPSGPPASETPRRSFGGRPSGAPASDTPRRTDGYRPKRKPGGGSPDPSQRKGGRTIAAPPPPENPLEPIRLNRYIAQAGICSRRKADELILEGRVLLNGVVTTEMGVRVNPGDTVEVNGMRLTPRALDYFLLNKPGNVITTNQDEKGRSSVMDLIEIPEKESLHLYPVGRLDRHTVGVLLITNDGELAHRLMHPSYQIDKLYAVRTTAAIKPNQLEQLVTGVMLDDGLAQVDDARYSSPDNKHEIGIRLHEGRNRQIRRMLEVMGHEVEHLERVNYAGLTSDGVRRGKWRRLQPHEVKKLKRLVKLI